MLDDGLSARDFICTDDPDHAVKLIKFKNCRKVTSTKDGSSATQYRKTDPMITEEMSQSQLGYRAPELQSSSAQVTQACNIWSLGQLAKMLTT